MSQTNRNNGPFDTEPNNKHGLTSSAKNFTVPDTDAAPTTNSLNYRVPERNFHSAKESAIMASKQAQPTVKASTNIKKKKRKGLKPAAPADNVTRGFHTPTTSGGEESDVSAVGTPRIRPSVQSSPSSKDSPLVRGSSLTRAISALKLGSDELSLDMMETGKSEMRENQIHAIYSDKPNNTENSSVTLGCDSTSEKYQPRKIFGAIEGGLRHDSPHRKMAASDFEALKCLGKGAYGTVVLVRQRSTGRLFAQKQLKKASLTLQKRLVEQTKNERAILESVNHHPFVVKLFYAFQDQQKLYLILEYAQGGELFHHLALERTFTEEVAAFYMAEMVLALEHLHTDLGVVYRDLKPENCLLDAEGHLLLTDFGLSKVALEDPASEGSDSKCSSILGTIDYMAPEVVQGRPYDAAVDWWSLGALGFDLLTGSPPFSSNNHTKTQQKILHGKLALPYYLSPDAKDILTRLLRKDPKKRLGGNMPSDMKAIKGHRFFRKVDWGSLRDRDVIAPIQPIITDPAAAENFASEFTGLALSPVASHAQAGFSSRCHDVEYPDKADFSWKEYTDDTFGGFSYVASRSLIEAGGLQ